LNYQDRQLEPVTVSVGVAIYPHHAQTADNLLRQADIALYIAKDAGRNTVALASA
jgi:diguanylate cyclase (GGDEF)-like protein